MPLKCDSVLSVAATILTNKDIGTRKIANASKDNEHNVILRTN